ncbi:MAG: hypothetical protein ACO3C1_05385 [Ilumatobacteraceae bacterium]
MTHVLRTRRLVGAVAAAATAGLIAVVGTALAATVSVSVGNYYFEDASVGDGKVTATVGDQLRFTVVEGAGHTVTISALGIDSGQLPIGAVYVTPVLTTPGTYSLVCRTHTARGHQTTLVVLAAGGGGSGGGGGGGVTTTRPPATTTPATATTAPGTSLPTDTPRPDSGASTSIGSDTATGEDSDTGSGSGSGADPSAGATTAAGGSVDGTLPVGVTVTDRTPWMRGVWVALAALPLFVAAAAAADWASRRRRYRAVDLDDDTPPEGTAAR